MRFGSGRKNRLPRRRLSSRARLNKPPDCGRLRDFGAERRSRARHAPRRETGGEDVDAGVVVVMGLTIATAWMSDTFILVSVVVVVVQAFLRKTG